MKESEKAKELFDKMYNVDDVIGNYPMCFDTAKQCALIAVDEIIKQTPEFIPQETYIGDSCGVDYFMNEMFEYWNNVKNEIENL
jgi:hypothetical protein